VSIYRLTLAVSVPAQPLRLLWEHFRSWPEATMESEDCPRAIGTMTLLIPQLAEAAVIEQMAKELIAHRHPEARFIGQSLTPIRKEDLAPDTD